eukprot:6455731-Amphidinium_carterae.2
MFAATARRSAASTSSTDRSAGIQRLDALPLHLERTSQTGNEHAEEQDHETTPSNYNEELDSTFTRVQSLT